MENKTGMLIHTTCQNTRQRLLRTNDFWRNSRRQLQFYTMEKNHFCQLFRYFFYILQSIWTEMTDFLLISISLTPLQQKSLISHFRRQNEQQYRSPSLPPFFSASIREGRVALSVGHPRGTHSRYVIGCCLIPLGICGLKNNSRRITYGIGCVWRMPSLSPLSSLASSGCFYVVEYDFCGQACFVFVCLFFHGKRNPLSKRVNKRGSTRRTSIKT